MSTINLEDWLISEDFAAGTAGTGDVAGTPGGPPVTDPYVGGAVAPGASPGGDPNNSNMMSPDENEKGGEEVDYYNDPEVPDMPEEEEVEELNFDSWKKKFLVDSTKGNVGELKDMILNIRDEELGPYERRFVEDNLQVLFLRENSNIDKASKEVRKLIKEDLDHNNPATSIVSHMVSVLNTVPLLNEVFIKLSNMGGLKADLYREYIAALTGSVVVGGGGGSEDIFLNEKDYSVRISTRMNSDFGLINLGPWSLRASDPKRFLQSVELRKLEDGSPEEKRVLKFRVIMESIAKAFHERAFIFNVVDEKGTIYMIGWDLSTSLKSAYTEGRLLIRTPKDDNTEVMIDEDGAIIQFPEIKVLYVDEGAVDDNGNIKKEEYEFMERRNGQLFLTATLKTLQEAANSFPGIILKSIPYNGNKSDLSTIKRCIASSSELLLRNC